MKRHPMHARFVAADLALVLGLTLAVPPTFAAEHANAASSRPIAAAASARVAAAPAKALAQAAPAPPSSAPARTSDKPFFKTTRGKVALVLIAGTLGYMGYSMSSDRVKSPAR